MSKPSNDALTVNQLSLVMTLDNDIVKACREFSLSPALTETLVRLHGQQVELEKAINELRSTNVLMAQTIEKMVDHNVGLTYKLTEMQDRIGFNQDELVSSESIGQDSN